MAIVSTAISNMLAVNNAIATTERQLALRVYAGEVTAAFRRKNILAPLHVAKDMRYGRSMQFPATGRMTASFHVKGNNILLTGEGPADAMNTVERLIHVDNMLVCSTFIPELDEMLSHFDQRSSAAEECGQALAYFYDQLGFRVLARAARTDETSEAAFIPSDMGETSGDSTGIGGYYQSAFNTEALIIAALEQAALQMDTKYVPDEDRHCPLSPTSYWTLINNDKTVSTDYSRTGADFSLGRMHYAAGMMLHKTNHIPSDYWVDPAVGTDSDSGVTNTPTGAYNRYGGDMTSVHTVCFHRSAIGTVWLMDVTLESEHLIEYIGSPVLAKMMAGVGRLRPEAAVEINSDTTQPSLNPTS